jgi:hypothetical protein
MRRKNPASTSTDLIQPKSTSKRIAPAITKKPRVSLCDLISICTCHIPNDLLPPAYNVLPGVHDTSEADLKLADFDRSRFELNRIVHCLGGGLLGSSVGLGGLGSLGVLDKGGGPGDGGLSGVKIE